MNYYDPQTAWLAVPLNSFYKLNSYISASEFKHAFSNKSEVDFGYEVSYNTMTSNETETGKSFQGALFAAGKIEFGSQIVSKITLYPSFRYDYHSNIGKSVPTGKLGMNLKPFDRLDMSFKSSVGSNFAAPTFNELYWKGLGNENLLPERSICFDAGMYYAFRFISNNQFEFSYFNINTTDRIVWTPDAAGVWRPINVGKVKSEGVDISLKSYFKLTDFLSAEFRFNYNYGSSLKKNMDFPGDQTYNKQIISWPMEYAKSSLSFSYNPSIKLMKMISMNVFYTFAGKRFIDQENTKFVPYYEIIDANVGTALNIFKTETIVKFIVNNLTNKDYQVVSGYPMPLRNYKLQIGIKY
jgi:iron complex outermembrane receptor protein